MSNYKSVIEQLLGLMDEHQESPVNAINAVIGSGKLPKKLCDKWVILITERHVRAILGCSGCEKWEDWANKFLSGESTEALASQASLEVAELICELQETQKGASSDTNLSKMSSTLWLAYAAQSAAEAIEMWHGGEMEDVPFNAKVSGGYVATASIIAAIPSISSWDSYFDAFCDLTERGNYVLLRAVLRGALEEDK